MRYAPFGVTNLAWPGPDLDEALGLLRQLGCDAVEIAPFAVFQRWNDLADDARRLRERIERHGLTCSALQGILFNVPDAALFTSEQSRARLTEHLALVAELAGILGARACVLGAPRQRDPGDLPTGEAWAIAVDTLRRIGPAYAAQNTALAFEANARRYACRFITTTRDAIRLVAEVNTPGIGLQIDTGTIFLEDEDPNVLRDAIPLAAHAHVSEEDLRPTGGSDHTMIARALRDGGYHGSLSVEMKTEPDWRAAIRNAVAFARATYV